jgi:toxin ParE1/3/4
LYRVAPGRVIEIVRVLHDKMDLQRHLPSADNKNGK